MSDQKPSYPLDLAERVAQTILDALLPYCERAVIAGSIRRGAPVVHDVEIVAIPKTRRVPTGLFDDEASAILIDELDEALELLRQRGTIHLRKDRSGRVFWGKHDKRIAWPHSDAGETIAVDLFCATPPTWGAKLVIRTGPWELSKRLVTPRGKGGLLPHDLQFRDGGLYRYTDPLTRRFVPTPEESDVFAALGLPFVEPDLRTPRTFAKADWPPGETTRGSRPIGRAH